MKMNQDVLQRMARARAEEFEQDAKFNKLFAEKWLPESGFDTGGAQASLLAPLHPEVYVFGPRIHRAVSYVDQVIDLVVSGNQGTVTGFAVQMRDAYRDEFGDINDYDWDLYRRYVSRNRLGFTTRVDRVYDLQNGAPASPFFVTKQGQVPFATMLQEMMYCELYGPKLQKLSDSWLHKGAQRHAVFVKKWLS